MKALLIITGIICMLFCLGIAVTNSGAVLLVSAAGFYASVVITLVVAARDFR